MTFKANIQSFFLSSLALTLLTACPQPNTNPVVTPKPSIAPEKPVASSNPMGTPTPKPTAKPVNPVVAPSNAPVVEAVKLASIALTTANRFLTAKGETAQFNVTLKDASGQVVRIDSSQLKWSSFRPGDFSVDANGMAFMPSAITQSV